MVKKFMWLVLLVSVIGLGLVANGCAKKDMVKVGVAAEPMTPMNANPEGYVAVQKPPQEQNRLPAANVPQAMPMKEANVQPKEEPANLAPKMEAFDLTGLRVQFAFDDYNLSSKAEDNLNRIAEWMKNNPGKKIQIQGYTCDIGTDEYNLALSDQRAENAEKYLEAMGVEHNRLSRISYGRENPRAPNTDEAHRSMNRRDEFVMMN